MSRGVSKYQYKEKKVTLAHCKRIGKIRRGEFGDS